METKTIIAFIEKQRLNKGISKRDMCANANVKENTYWRYLQGLEPPFCTVNRLLKGVNCDLKIFEPIFDGEINHFV